MNHSVYRIFLDIDDAASQVSLCAKKGDSNRRISAGFTENGKPYNISDDCTAIFRAKKPDGTVLYNTCLIDGNIISFDLTTQTTAEAGAVNCEITLYGQDKRQITSPRFALIVDDTVYDDSEIESSDEFTALAEAMAQFGGANSAAEAAASSEQAAASSAATATEKAKSAASSATAAANSAATATKKASAAATSASGAASSKTAAAASEAAAKTAAAEAKAVAVPLEPAGTEKKSVQSKGHNNKITGKISGSEAFGNGNVLEGDYHDWQIATGWQNQSRGNNTLNAGSRNIVEGHNGANIGQDNESRDYNGHNIGFQNVAAARQTGNVGTGLLTDTPEQIAVGTTNAPNADAVLMVGNGDAHRRNAMTVSRDGKITVGGHFEEAVLENPGVAIAETLSVGGNIPPRTWSLNSDGNKIVYEGLQRLDIKGHRRSTATVTALHAAGGTRAQMLVKNSNDATVQIEAGKGYRIRFYVMAKTPSSFLFRYWLTADASTTCYISTAQKNAAVLYETEGIPVTDAEWVRVECTIPAAGQPAAGCRGLC